MTRRARGLAVADPRSSSRSKRRSCARSTCARANGHAGQVLARLDSTFAAADLGALAAQVSSLQAEVARLQAEAEGKPFTYSGLDPACPFRRRSSRSGRPEYDFKLENYRQRSTGSGGDRAIASDAAGLSQAPRRGASVRGDAKELERVQVGSRLNTLGGEDNRAEMSAASATPADRRGARRDLAAMHRRARRLRQSWRADVSQKLSDASKLSRRAGAAEQGQLRRQLVELRADPTHRADSRQGSVGSVLQSGEQLITLVPADAPLEVEAKSPAATTASSMSAIRWRSSSTPSRIHQYGLAHGTVRSVSADSFTAQDETAQSDRRGAAAGRQHRTLLPRPGRDRSGRTPRRRRLPRHAWDARDRRHQGRQADGAAATCWAGLCRSPRRGCANRDVRTSCRDVVGLVSRGLREWHCSTG